MSQDPKTSEPSLGLVVDERDELASDVVALRLRLPDGSPLPEWSPGAHIDLVLDHDLVRQYSLTGAGSDPAVWEVAVLREDPSRGGSERIFDTLVEGASVQVRGPRNHFPLAPANHYRFVAGGIGITPIRAMIEEAEARGCEWRLLYGGRTQASMAYVDELTSRYGDRVAVRPQDEHGLLDLRSFLADAPEGTLTYCCGPEPLLHAMETLRSELPSLELWVERFAPQAADPDRIDTEFEVELVQTGVTVTVPSDRSILDVAEEAGAFVTSSCAEGTCGSCETTVLEGDPIHWDSVLDANQRENGDTMMICVSRCRGDRLVLDL